MEIRTEVKFSYRKRKKGREGGREEGKKGREGGREERRREGERKEGSTRRKEQKAVRQAEHS